MGVLGGVSVLTRRGWPLLLSAPLAACVAAGPAPVAPAKAASQPSENATAMLQPIAGGAVRVRRKLDPAYTMSDGALAKRDADALCGKVISSIYDRYEAGAWVFVEGCA